MHIFEQDMQRQVRLGTLLVCRAGREVTVGCRVVA